MYVSSRQDFHWPTTFFQELLKTNFTPSNLENHLKISFLFYVHFHFQSLSFHIKSAGSVAAKRLKHFFYIVKSTNWFKFWIHLPSKNVLRSIYKFRAFQNLLGDTIPTYFVNLFSNTFFVNLPPLQNFNDVFTTVN